MSGPRATRSKPASNTDTEGAEALHPQGGRLLTVNEAAEFLNVSVRFVRRIIFERRVPVIRIGRHVRLQESDLERFVALGREESWSG